MVIRAPQVDRRSGGRRLAEPHTPAATALRAIAERLAVRARRLAGRSLDISPASTAVDPADLEAVDLLAAFRAHELCPVEATAAMLARIAKLDPRVNAKPRRRTPTASTSAARFSG